MPFRIRKAPKKDLYWVIGPDGKHHSKDPLPKARAEAQMKALYSAMRREEEAIVPNAKEEKAIEKKMEGGGPLPELSVLQQIAKASYSTSPPQQIGPFKLRSYTPTLKFYVLPDPEDQRFTDTIVVGIRGTNTSDKQDLWADTQLAIGKLEDTPRWKKDLADFKSFMSRLRYADDIDVYGVAHSLGGSILDMFLKKGLIQQGVSYNPAIQLGDAQKDLNNRRIYQDGDPLLAIMGRSAKNVEIRPKKQKQQSIGRRIANVASYFIPYVGLVTKGMDTLDAHALDNFIGGTHLKNVLKKLGLKDEGHSLTELAKASRIPRKTLQEVYNRGIGAYTTNPSSVRMKGSFKKGVDAPMSQKLSKEQWAMARVYSFIDGNPKHDTDLRGGMDHLRHQEGMIDSRPPSPFGSEYDDSDDDDHWTASVRLTKDPLLEIEEGDIDPISHEEFEDGDIVLYVPSGGRFKAVKVSTIKEGYPLPQDQAKLERDWFPVPYHHPPVSKRKVKIKPRGSGRLRGGRGMTKILNKMIKEVALDWKSEFGRKVKEAYDEAKRNLGMMMGTQSKKRFEVMAFYGRLILLAEEYAPDQVEHIKDKSDYYKNLILRTRGDSVTRHSGSEGEVDHADEVEGIDRASGRVRGGMTPPNQMIKRDKTTPPSVRSFKHQNYAHEGTSDDPDRPLGIPQSELRSGVAERLEQMLDESALKGLMKLKSGRGRVRGGADEDPQPKPRKEPKRVSRMRQGSKLNPDYKPVFGPSPPPRHQRQPDPRGPRRRSHPPPPPPALPTITHTLPSSSSDDVELDPTDFGSGHSAYLRQARAKAKAYGLDPKKLKLATDGKHKLDYDGVKFGLKHYNDFLLWSAEEKAGRVPKGTAEKKRKLYRARAEKIKGEWKANKTSPNNLAIHILW